MSVLSPYHGEEGEIVEATQVSNSALRTSQDEGTREKADTETKEEYEGDIHSQVKAPVRRPTQRRRRSMKGISTVKMKAPVRRPRQRRRRSMKGISTVK